MKSAWLVGFKILIWTADTPLPKRVLVAEKLRNGHLYGCHPGFQVKKSLYAIHGEGTRQGRTRRAIEIEGFIGHSEAVDAIAGRDAHPARNPLENMFAFMKRLQDVLGVRCRIWSMEGYEVGTIQTHFETWISNSTPVGTASSEPTNRPPAVLKADGSGAVLRSDGSGSVLRSRPEGQTGSVDLAEPQLSSATDEITTDPI